MRVAWFATVATLGLMVAGCAPGAGKPTGVLEAGNVYVVDSEASRGSRLIGNSSQPDLACLGVQPDVAREGLNLLSVNVVDEVQLNAAAAEQLLRLMNDSMALGLLRTQAELFCILVNFSKVSLTPQQVLETYGDLLQATRDVAVVEATFYAAQEATAGAQEMQARQEIMAALLNAITERTIIVSDSIASSGSLATPQGSVPPGQTPPLVLSTEQFLTLVDSLLNDPVSATQDLFEHVGPSADE